MKFNFIIKWYVDAEDYLHNRYFEKEYKNMDIKELEEYLNTEMKRTKFFGVAEIEQ